MLGRIKQWMQGQSAGRGQEGPGGPGGQCRARRGEAADLNILMVCSGNICRSPTAEAVLRFKLQRAGLSGVLVDSAGTHGYHVREAPDPRAQAAARRRGYELSQLRARPVQEADFERFQWLLAMDQSHLDWLHQHMSQAQRQQARLLLQHARRFKGTAEVPDPYYGSPDGFEHVLDLVEDACDGLVEAIKARQVAK